MREKNYCTLRRGVRRGLPCVPAPLQEIFPQNTQKNSLRSLRLSVKSI